MAGAPNVARPQTSKSVVGSRGNKSDAVFVCVDDLVLRLSFLTAVFSFATTLCMFAAPDSAQPQTYLTNLLAQPVILTPRPGPAPRINGPKIYGARPGNPFLYRIPVQGERPMRFSASRLPRGLNLDAL